MAFESIKKAGPTWQPTHTGSEKNEDLKKLEPTDKSYLIGYYLGPSVIQTKNGESTTHLIKMDKVGDKSHINGEIGEEKEITVWGTTVLNDLFSKVKPGAFTRVLWKGKQKPKSGGKPYHIWDVAVDSTVEPLISPASSSQSFTADNTSTEPSVSPSNEPVAANAGAEEDDLPF